MRTVFAVFVAISVLGAAACGGGDSSPKAADGTATAPATAKSGFASSYTPTPEAPPFGAPTKVTGRQPAFQVIFGRESYTPTFEEFTSLATVEITAGGKTYRGVPLTFFAERMKAVADSTFSVNGYGPDFKRQQFIRHPLKEAGSETVLFVDGDGYISLASSKIPQAEWLRAILTINFP